MTVAGILRTFWFCSADVPVRLKMKGSRNRDDDDEAHHENGGAGGAGGAAMQALPAAFDPRWANLIQEFQAGGGLHAVHQETKSDTLRLSSDRGQIWASAGTTEPGFMPFLPRASDAERTQAMNSWLNCLASPYANDHVSLRDISSNLVLSNDALCLPSAVSLLMQVEGLPRHTNYCPGTDTIPFHRDSVLHPVSRSVPLLPSVSSCSSSLDRYSRNFFKGDFVDSKEIMEQKKCMSQLNRVGCDSLEAVDLEKSQVLRNPIFLPSERCINEFNSGDLQIVLCKELTNSDVGSIGRIVLPKKEAEAYLPPLFERDGMILQMGDLTLPVTWKFKYRYWPNNKSRMYILEATGDFVRVHGLQAGDSFVVYRSGSSGGYVVRGKKAISAYGPSFPSLY